MKNTAVIYLLMYALIANNSATGMLLLRSAKINQAKLFQKPYHTNNTTFYPFDQETRMYFAEQYEQKERTIPKKTSNRLTDPKLKKALWNNDILLSNIAEQNKAINKLLKEGDSLPPIHVEYLINTINLIENSLRN